jgi:hypothetical protein
LLPKVWTEAGIKQILTSVSPLYSGIRWAKISQNREAWVEKQYFSNSFVFSNRGSDSISDPIDPTKPAKITKHLFSEDFLCGYCVFVGNYSNWITAATGKTMIFASEVLLLLAVYPEE